MGLPPKKTKKDLTVVPPPGIEPGIFSCHSKVRSHEFALITSETHYHCAIEADFDESWRLILCIINCWGGLVGRGGGGISPIKIEYVCTFTSFSEENLNHWIGLNHW